MIFWPTLYITEMHLNFSAPLVLTLNLVKTCSDPSCDRTVVRARRVAGLSSCTRSTGNVTSKNAK